MSFVDVLGVDGIDMFDVYEWLIMDVICGN